MVERAGCGLAVPPDDPDAFTEALRWLLTDPERSRAMGERGRQFVEQGFSPAAVAGAYEALFCELIADRRLAGRAR
jgi:glycosyltransferase involved in cell wall biosynthesis